MLEPDCGHCPEVYEVEALRAENGKQAASVASLREENEQLFDKLMAFATEHPVYKLSKALEAENNDFRDLLREAQVAFEEMYPSLITSKRCKEMIQKIDAALGETEGE